MIRKIGIRNESIKTVKVYINIRFNCCSKCIKIFPFKQYICIRASRERKILSIKLQAMRTELFVLSDLVFELQM